MKTIYFYGIDNVKGGIENYSHTLINGILSKSSNYKFHIISCYKDYAYRNSLISKGCSETILPNKSKHPLKFYKQLKQIIKTINNNDLIQINLMSYCNFLLLNALRKRKNVIIVGHSTKCESIKKKIIHNFFSLFYRKKWNKVAVSNEVVSFMKWDKNNVRIINNGINIKKYEFNDKKRLQYRENLQLKDRFAICQVGRISNTKNQIFSCNAMKGINDKNIHLYLVGTVTNKNVFKTINKINLPNVHYIGESNNINELYSAFDMYIMPSLFESAGISLYEAIANGLPCIISNNIPTKNLDLQNVKILELNKEKWINEIENSINKKRTNNNCDAISADSQINNYIDYYNSL